ncbi:MAG TPA: response regulator transcription factor [Vicinamibacterales bacterium]|nr:response regulator transcription factor [Vicinamibacterales bacterium]
MTKHRALVAHHFRLFLAGLAYLLDEEFDVVRAIDDMTTLADAAVQLRPDVVVQGLTADPHAGLDILKDVHRAVPDTPIVVVTKWDDRAIATEAFRRGASAYVLQSSTEAELLDGVRAAIAKVPYVTPEFAASLLVPRVESDRPLKLTPRQRAILQELAAGKSMKEVAAALKLRTRTVAYHKYEIMRRLKITTNAELVRFAVKEGLI